MSPRDLGTKAYHDGESVEDNPYVYGTTDWNEWHEGYTQAEAEDQ